MSLLLVMDNPLNIPDVAANVYASSENASWPSTNLYDFERRRKAWRSAWYWEIPSGSRTIVFQDAAGVNKTATIAAGNYTSDALLFAAIVAAMTAAGGVATYTITRDTTTNRVKISSNVGGGATVFRLMWTSATGLGALLGYDTSTDDTGATTYTADLLRIHTTEFVKWDLGIPTNPTAFACFCDRNAPMPFSPSATLTLEAAHTDSWTAPALSISLTYRENVLAYIDADGLAGAGAAGYRYWRLKIVDVANPNGYVTLGVAYLGTHADITRGCPEFPLEQEGEDYTTVQLTESGQDYAGKKAQTDILTLAWAKLDTASKERLEDVWAAYGLHSNFIVHADVDGAYSSDPYSQVRLVAFNAKPTRRLVSVGNWSYTWQLKEAL